MYFEQNDTTDVESNNGTEVSEIPEDDTLLDNDIDDQEQRKPPLRYLQASYQLVTQGWRHIRVTSPLSGSPSVCPSCFNVLVSLSG